MGTDIISRVGLLDELSRQPADGLLTLIGMHRDDQREHKIDVGVGVYRTVEGDTPVFAAVKDAERFLLESQTSKGYLGPEGDVRFFAELRPILFGGDDPGGRICGLQTPGGTGALRLAAELIVAARPAARVLVGTPTWANHMPIFGAANLSTASYRYFDVVRQSIRFDEMMTALGEAAAGDVVLLHGCCHNPVGADLDALQWRQVADIMAQRGLIPLIDLAYQGLGLGLDDDAAGLRQLIGQVDEALIAYSCDKNFGLYRERTGALYVMSRNADAAAVTQTNLLALARTNWSMPPDHGAAIVRIILEDPAMSKQWHTELTTMRKRIIEMRRRLAASDAFFEPMARQQGMFSMLPLTPQQVMRLCDDHAIYMAQSGRINVAGLTPATIDPFAEAVLQVQ